MSSDVVYEANIERQVYLWIASRIRSAAHPTETVDININRISAALQYEGVTNLFLDSVDRSDINQFADEELLKKIRDQSKHINARIMALNFSAREIQSVAEKHGIELIWLKGVALSNWLYSRQGLREFDDIDLLCKDRAAAKALGHALEKIGYRTDLNFIQGEICVYEYSAFSPNGRGVCDIHWQLINNALFAKRLSWTEMFEDSVALPELGQRAYRLSAAHALLHACMHWATNQVSQKENRLCWLYDLYRFCSTLTSDDWNNFLDLAISRRLAGVCYAALHSASSVFSFSIPDQVAIGLETCARKEKIKNQALRTWIGFQYANLVEIDDWKMRKQWICEKFIGNRAYLKNQYGADGASLMISLLRRTRHGIRRIFS